MTGRLCDRLGYACPPGTERSGSAASRSLAHGSVQPGDLAHAGIAGSGVTSWCSGIPRADRDPKMHVLMHVQILDSTGRAGAPWPGDRRTRPFSRDSPALPGTPPAAGPAHPLAGSCGRGSRHQRAPPPPRGRAHRPQKARPRRRARRPRLTATGGTTARHGGGPGPGTGRAGNSRPAIPVLTPVSARPTRHPGSSPCPASPSATSAAASLLARPRPCPSRRRPAGPRTHAAPLSR